MSAAATPSSALAPHRFVLDDHAGLERVLGRAMDLVLRDGTHTLLFELGPAFEKPAAMAWFAWLARNQTTLRNRVEKIAVVPSSLTQRLGMWITFVSQPPPVPTEMFRSSSTANAWLWRTCVDE